jgi:hypothetical protein
MRALYDSSHPSTRRWRAIALAIMALLFIWVGPADAADTYPVDGRCEWRNPAGDTYTGTIAAAVERHTDIPPATRAKLAAAMSQPRKAADHVTITRDSVSGPGGTYTLRDMNFGKGTICWGAVTRDSWPVDRTERALVFCEDGYCLARHSICRNVTRAYRSSVQQLAQVPGGLLMDAPPALEVPESWSTMRRLDWVAPVVGEGPSPVVPSGSGVDEGSEPFASTGYTPWWFTGTSGWLPAPPMAGPPITPGQPGAPGDPTAGTPIPPWGPGVPGIPGSPWDPVIPVPEPSTYAMMLLGLGLVAWLARRRRTGGGARKDCGEAGHAEGKCGNAGCLNGVAGPLPEKGWD